VRKTVAVSGVRVLSDLRAAYLTDLTSHQRSALTGWASFSTTFAGVRLITHAIKDDRGPFHNVGAGGVHLHHYMWGLLGLAGVGAVAVGGDQASTAHPLVATVYGSSLALIVDEFALLLDLQDVYWQKQGRVSVDLAVAIIAALGLYFTGPPLVRHFRHRRALRRPGSA
jgi:hypothetical protein